MTTTMRDPQAAAGLAPLLSPQSIAVIGASSDRHRIRGMILHTLLEGGFPGRIYPVNPSHREVQGLTAYPSLEALPEPVDLAMIALPANVVPKTLEECAAAGIKAAVVYTAGAAQAAPGEVALHEQIEAVSRRTGIRVLGPNTEGFFNVGEGVAANFSIVVRDEAGAATRELAGGRGISIVSQSGGLGFGLYSRGRRQNLPFRHVVTTGNESDVEALELVEYMVDEGKSAAIMMFIEGFKRPDRFERVAARAADAGVPLIVMKTGRSAASQRAAISHTAHLTGADTAYDAMFHRYGVIRVSDPEEMVSAAAGFCQDRLPKGNRVCILTGTGGTGAWIADLCAQNGLDVPEPDDALTQALREVVPDYGSSGNPIDITAKLVEDGGVTLADTLKILGPIDYLDAIVIIFSLAPLSRIKAFRPLIEPLLKEIDKPVLFVSQTLPDAGNLKELGELGIYNYSFQGCAYALKVMDGYRRFQERWKARTHGVAEPGDPVTLPIRSDGAIDRAAMSALMARYRIPVPPETVAVDAKAAVVAAEAMGYPVVLKIESADVPHKTDAGGVALNLASADAVRLAHGDILASVKRHVPRARIDGVLVQKMMPAGLEMVVSAIDDPDFGPLVVIGLGGIYVEMLRDVVFEPVPIGPNEALGMIERLNGVAVLHGLRGAPPSDIGALADLVVSLARLLVDARGQIAEIEFNPVMVYPAGQGLAAVDVLIAPKAGSAGAGTGH